MIDEKELIKIGEPLAIWFRQNARVLPWREDPSPYRVWVSEIMLQQTRVEAVKPYFDRFMTALPEIKDLAECPEDQLLKLWEGLGYYNRVRNLQIAARTIMEKYQGQMPANYDQLLELKGIGHYTAGAISSIAFHISRPAVDGNVLRVVMRLCNDDSDIMKQSVKNMVEEKLQYVMDYTCSSDTDLVEKPGNTCNDDAFLVITPGEFNQAMMELGAMVCAPNGAPHCQECPLAHLCQAREAGTALNLPVKSKAKARRIEQKTILIIRDGQRIILRKRPKKGLLAGLYEFPNVEGNISEKEALQLVEDMGLSPLHIQGLEEAKHIFSHVEWHMTGYMIRVDQLKMEESKKEDLFIDVSEAQEQYPIPAAFEAYSKYMNMKLGNNRFTENA